MAPIIVNSAHKESDRPPCLAFSHNGDKLYTGGDDALIRIWSSDMGSDQDPPVLSDNDDSISAFATSKKCWLSASYDACVRSYDVDGGTVTGFVTRAIAVPIHSIAIDPKSDRVAVASDELEVKIVDLNDITKVQKLEGHRKGVRRVTWHPSGTILTTCGSDGDIIVWDVTPGEEPKQIETITGIIPAVDSESPDFAHDCSAVWHPSGQYFFVATRAHELVTISRDDWKKTFTFSNDDVTGATTALALSPNGTYLASASKTGIFIWSTATRKVLFRHVPAPSTAFSTVSQLAFSPTQNLLAWIDAGGCLTRWPDPIPATSPGPVTAHSASSNVGVPLKKKADPLLFDEDLDDGVKKAPVVGDDDYGLDDEDWMIDDIGLLDKVEKEKEQGEKGFAREMVSVTKAQPPFQPASTPMINKKRYLAYNMIGVIEVTDQDTHHIVNVEFHDRSTRVGSHFQDSSKCNLASLGERGALYACPPENEHPAQITYKPYSGWASSGEWHYPLPPGETALALAAGGTPPSKSLRNQSSDGDLEGNGNVVVATSRGYLRFLTGGGVQRYVWALGADVVSMVAGREWVFVVHRDGGTSLDGCQNLAYTLVALDTFDTVQHGRLPLPKGSVLKWIGISEEGAPAMYDSTGLLSVLDRFRRPGQARWTPVLDTNTLARRKGKDESYWPVGVSGTLFMCLILKGREEHPGFPRPLIQELEVQMPLINLDAPQGQMEERFLREELQIGMLRDSLGSDLTNDEVSRREFSLDKELIQLIQLACKSDKHQRALDAAVLLHHTPSFDMAIKVAQFYHLVGLQEKMTALKAERAERDRLEEEKEQRKKWGRHSAPIAAPQSNASSSSHRRQFEEFAPPPAAVRKSLAPAVPVAVSAFGSRGAGGSAFGSGPKDFSAASGTQSSAWDDSFDSLDADADASFSSIGDGKRKRDDAIAVESDPSEAGSTTKKRALSGVDTSELNGGKSTKTSNNPFARKPQDTKSNPFSRPVGSKANVATKSNSFFDKVDEANDIATQTKAIPAKAKGKEKEKKDGSRQTTLFGLPLGLGPEKKARGRLAKDKKGGADDVEMTPAPSMPTSKTSTPEPSKDVPAPPKDTADTQVTDVTMVDAPSGNNVNQAVPDVQEPSQAPDSPEPEIEWPPSPPRGAESQVSEVTVN